MTFPECVSYCLDNQEFVSNFNRLSGYTLGDSLKRSPIDRMVDEAAGYNPEEENLEAFCNFVYEYVWLRVPRESQKSR